MKRLFLIIALFPLLCAAQVQLPFVKSLTIEVTPDEYNQFLRYKVSQQHAAQVASTNAPVVRAPLPPRVIPKTNAPVAKKANATTISPQPASQTPTK